jgi:hypothetical protein
MSRRSVRWWFLAVPLVALATLMAVSFPAGAEDTKKQPKPQVEVVFCLDTTCSLEGMITCWND